MTGVTWKGMSSANKQNPFEPLGTHLRRMREKRQETLAEVSGAVEIDPDTLNSIEEGMERPGEDILLLLISHFATKEDLATKLWELAGYNQDELPVQNVVNNIHGQAQNGVVVLPADTQIVYTDMVHVMVNNYGVIMNFMQTAGPNSQPLAISRIGMSKEHAQSVLEVLQKTLSLHEPKSLPAKNSKHPNEKTDK
jgi:DNA-binding XRE family transcriptional regulator